MTAACDPDYERQWDSPVWRIVYDWRLRCYRRQLESRLLFGRVQSVDPDAALAPDALDGEPRILRSVQRLADELECNGPGTDAELQARLGLESYDGMAADVARKSRGLIRVVGERMVLKRTGVAQLVRVYGLACHEGAIPPPLHPALVYLREHGGWLSVQEMADALDAKPQTVRRALDNASTRLESYIQAVRKGSRDYLVTFYRWRG